MVFALVADLVHRKNSIDSLVFHNDEFDMLTATNIIFTGNQTTYLCL